MADARRPRPRPAAAPSSLLVTGSSGFIGSHLCRALEAGPAAREGVRGLDLIPPPGLPAPDAILADIRRPADLRALESWRLGGVVHLAARAEVVTPFEELDDLVATNVGGTLNILAAAKPERFFFASSSAVYGDLPAAGGPARASHPLCPVGTYGMTKLLGEMICAEWARKTGSAAVCLRFGNVVGAGCRGLIPYLVNHALQHPDGSVPARGRGGGRVVRDYVPVRYAVDVLAAALAADWKAGAAAALNVGTGRHLTNREVASVAQRVLRRHGYVLTIDWRNPLAPGEARAVVLDMTGTTRRLGLPAPGLDEVVEAIEEATWLWLKAGSAPIGPAGSASG